MMPEGVGPAGIGDFQDMAGDSEAGFSFRRLPVRPGVVLRLVAGLSWAVPLILLGISGWLTWNQELKHLDRRVKNTLGIISEEATKVFETQEMALRWIDDRIRGKSWTEIENTPELSRLAATLAQRSGYRGAFFLADATGNIRLDSRESPVQGTPSAAALDCFSEAMSRSSGIHIGKPTIDRISGNTAFCVALRRSTADGSFDGIVALSLPPAYFEGFFDRIGGVSQDSTSLMRADGTILARYPEVAAGTVLLPSHPFMKMIAANIANEMTVYASPIDGIDRMGGLVGLGRYGLFVTYAVDLGRIRGEWFESFEAHGLAALVSSFVLFTLSTIALRLARNEQRAVRAWRKELEQRRRVEAEMRHASKMEALGRMAGGIAHHFNNLLPAITGLLEQTLGEVPTGGPTARRLERMIEAVAQGRRIVRQILIFSRRDVATSSTVRLSEVISETVALAAAGLPPGIRVGTRLEDAREVAGDRAQLKEVFMNLLANAVQAIGPDGGRNGGTVTITAEPAIVDAEDGLTLGLAPGDYVKAVCRDDGAGMSPEVAERAFDPFFTTKPVGEGTGLGLAIVHGIVTGLGGVIHVESVPGKGSSFILHLPVRTHSESRATPNAF